MDAADERNLVALASDALPVGAVGDPCAISHPRARFRNGGGTPGLPYNALDDSAVDRRPVDAIDFDVIAHQPEIDDTFKSCV